MGLLQAGNDMAQAYVAAFAKDGAQRYIANLDTRVETLDWGGHLLPVTVNDGAAQGTFVCSTRVGLIDYTLEELTRFPDPRVAPVLRGIVRGVGALLSFADLDRIVHINNWMMSTNLPVPLDTALSGVQTRALVARFPDHLLAMRSLMPSYSADLMAALESAGWMLLPSRQNYLVDDVRAQSLRHRDSRRDHALWQRSAFQYEELVQISAADASRIAELYKLLYLDKYSHLNPAFTAEFMRLGHRIGLLRFLVLRDTQGVIQGFGAMRATATHATMPMLGYDTSLDQRLGLYRLANHAGALYAAERGLRLNMSSGAAAFKRNRGGRAEIEYTAYYQKHLSLQRRLPSAALAVVARRVGVPVLRKYQL